MPLNMTKRRQCIHYDSPNKYYGIIPGDTASKGTKHITAINLNYEIPIGFISVFNGYETKMDTYSGENTKIRKIDMLAQSASNVLTLRTEQNLLLNQVKLSCSFVDNEFVIDKRV